MKKIKIALFGGTFDPIHLGHTTVAAAAAEHIGADKLVFIPAKCSPLKQTLPQAGDADRLNMLGLAIEDIAQFELSDCELKKGAASYTLLSVRQFQIDLGPEVLIHWLIGADGIDDLSHWYRIADLIDECNLCVMFRAGCSPPDFAGFEPLWGHERVEKLRRNVIRTPLIDISSTEIRNRLAEGGDLSGMLHPAVLSYIRRHGLYRTKA
jgi:nicotinate-nucleotide adenylyltransferase